jgi:hypothetical protein
MRGSCGSGDFVAWLAWLFIHLIFLVSFRNKVTVLMSWAYAYFTYGRGARLITGREWNKPAVQSTTREIAAGVPVAKRAARKAAAKGA